MVAIKKMAAGKALLEISPLSHFPLNLSGDLHMLE